MFTGETDKPEEWVTWKGVPVWHQEDNINEPVPVGKSLWASENI